MRGPKSRGTHSPENPAQNRRSLCHDEKHCVDPGPCPVRYRALRGNPKLRGRQGPSDAAQKGCENEKRLISDKSHQNKHDAEQEICEDGEQIRGDVRPYPCYQHESAIADPAPSALNISPQPIAFSSTSFRPTTGMIAGISEMRNVNIAVLIRMT